jgi:hypothetical protein
MYCPNCASQNMEDAQFCRTCGADISFLSKAMSRRGSDKGQEDAEVGLRYSFIGAGFLLIAILMLFAAPAPANWAISLSLLCAAFPLLGSGVAKILATRRGLQQGPGSATRVDQELPASSVDRLPSPNTAEMTNPVTVTEGTTKILQEPKGGEIN